MARKSISDIVLRAVVDTSGVAAGLNNIGAQVSGRSFGQSGGGPTGASGAAGGFVNPHGGGAGPGTAAVAAAAAAGAAAARAAGRPGMAGRIEREAERLSNTIFDNPLTAFMARRQLLPTARKIEELRSARALNVATSRSTVAATAWRNEQRRLEELNLRRGIQLNNLAQSRVGRMAGGAYGAARNLAEGGFQGATRFAGLMGLGRFAPLGGGAIMAGAPLAAAAGIHGLYRSRYQSATSDIERFTLGPDRQAAVRQRNFWRQPGQKPPLDLMDRFNIGAYKVSEAPWYDRAIKTAGEAIGNTAENLGARAAQQFTPVGLLRQASPLFSLGETLFNVLKRAMN